MSWSFWGASILSWEKWTVSGGSGAKEYVREPRGETADPSTPLRSGRDDKGKGWFINAKLATRIGSTTHPILPLQVEALLFTVSSRPKRSEAEGSAVSLEDPVGQVP